MHSRIRFALPMLATLALLQWVWVGGAGLDGGHSSVSRVYGDEPKEKGKQEVVLELASIEEIQKQLAKPTGKWVVVDVWGTSCAPCVREFPNLVKVASKYPDSVICHSINVDYIGLKKEPPTKIEPTVKEFLVKQKATFKNYLSTTEDSDAFAALEIESIPAILVYDPQGKLFAKLTDDSAGENGFTYEDDVFPLLEKQLQKGAVSK